ncbi:hypothetical protein EV652_10351 [Kribbella steppae]|uniref:Uncharacterized protein n=1 Tax=Kribbella steppae TaxID=2512223 RepID=A0A4R2HPG8_9ACTN|nr:hypothetical protein [Kribbella steppae]TCO33052.1 hypothetical protein EV652_10351 [Kribbella steppae]
MSDDEVPFDDVQPTTGTPAEATPADEKAAETVQGSAQQRGGEQAEPSAPQIATETATGTDVAKPVIGNTPGPGETIAADGPADLAPGPGPLKRLASPTSTARGPGRSRGRKRSGGGAAARAEGGDTDQAADPGGDLERRVGRTEFNDGALVRLRVPIRVDADSGRDVLTDIDVLAVDVDGRLRISRSILECKSGKGQAGEPDRLLWLAGLQRFLGFERAVLVRQTVSRRGRGLARALGLRTLDVATLASREAAHAWLPERFGHVDGAECLAAEKRTDTQLKGLGHIPPDLVAFLRFDALRSVPHQILRAVASLGRAVDGGGVLPNPTRVVLAGHALVVLIAAALADAGKLDEMSSADLLERTRRALVTGNPEDEQVLSILGRADALVAYSLERVHAAYREAGAKRLNVDFPSLKATVTTPPGWAPRYIDLVEKLRANPAVARQMLQTTELAVFEALVGGQAHRAPAFDHLFTQEHRYMLNVARRCLEDVAGVAVADALTPALDLDFSRGALARGDRDAAPKQS